MIFKRWTACAVSGRPADKELLYEFQVPLSLTHNINTSGTKRHVVVLIRLLFYM